MYMGNPRMSHGRCHHVESSLAPFFFFFFFFSPFFLSPFFATLGLRLCTTLPPSPSLLISKEDQMSQSSLHSMASTSNPGIGKLVANRTTFALRAATSGLASATGRKSRNFFPAFACIVLQI